MSVAYKTVRYFGIIKSYSFVCLTALYIYLSNVDLGSLSNPPTQNISNLPLQKFSNIICFSSRIALPAGSAVGSADLDTFILTYSNTELYTFQNIYLYNNFPLYICNCFYMRIHMSVSFSDICIDRISQMNVLRCYVLSKMYSFSRSLEPPLCQFGSYHEQLGVRYIDAAQ